MNQSIFERWRRRWWRPDAAALAAYDGLMPYVVVTGASEGIGLAFAKAFAAEKCRAVTNPHHPHQQQQEHRAVSAQIKHRQHQRQQNQPAADDANQDVIEPPAKYQPERCQQHPKRRCSKINERMIRPAPDIHGRAE